MRKTLSILLAAAMLMGLLSGCDEEAEETQPATRPAATTETAEEETTAPVETEESAEVEEASVLNTVVLRSGDEALQAEYILLAVNSEGPFHSEIELNEAGVDALVKWLVSKENRAVLEDFGVSEYGEAVFTLPEEPVSVQSWIPNATEETKTIRLSVVDTLEQSGILEQLLPIFEETYGYTVEVQDTSASGTLSAAKLGIFDLVLTEQSDAVENFITDGYARVVNGFETEAVTLCGMEYLLCGPKDDPAGAAGAETIPDAFAAIAAGEYKFLSRGDDSTVHKLEQSLWPADQAFGDWYLSVDTEMGPLLVMNEFEGGYVLTDKLTWLQYFQAEGVI